MNSWKLPFSEFIEIFSHVHNAWKGFKKNRIEAGEEKTGEEETGEEDTGEEETGEEKTGE